MWSLLKPATFSKGWNFTSATLMLNLAVFNFNAIYSISLVSEDCFSLLRWVSFIRKTGRFIRKMLLDFVVFHSRKNKNHSDLKNLGLLQLYSSVTAQLIISGITIYCCTMLENKHFVVLLTADGEFRTFLSFSSSCTVNNGGILHVFSVISNRQRWQKYSPVCLLLRKNETKGCLPSEWLLHLKSDYVTAVRWRLSNFKGSIKGSLQL